MKKTIYLFSAIAILGFAAIAPIVTSDTAEAARVRINSNKAVNEGDVKVVDAFTTEYESFSKDISEVDEGHSLSESSASSLNLLETKNKALQNHTFKNLNDDYKKAAENLKAEAKSMTENAKTLAETVLTIENGDATIADLNAQMTKYNDKITAMTNAVEKYQTEKKSSGNTTTVITLVGIGAALAGITWWGVRKRKANKAAAEKILFAGDAAGANTLSTLQKKALSELFGSLRDYEAVYRKSGATKVLDIFVKNGYDKYANTVKGEAFGKYRAVAYEYAALIANAKGDTAGAKEQLSQATSARGNADHYTETARSLEQKAV